jgi:hypothetical protein
MDRETLLEKAHKAFAKAGANPWTPEEKAAYAQGRKLLSKLAQEDVKRVAGTKLLPAPYRAEKRAFWGLREQIAVIPWKEFFKVEKNEMVVYRITPHAKVTNNNKRLWRAIFQMYAMYEKIGSRRIETDNKLKFHYRERDDFWFDVIFRQDDGERKIEFYVSTSEAQAEKLKRKIENKMDVTMVKADIAALQVPKENTIVQELKYLNHDIFSLNTNTNDTKTPIASILNTVDELQFDGDFARLSIQAEVENRSRWVKNASWAYEKMQKGKVPQRATMDGKKVAGAAKTLIGGIVNEVNDLIVESFQALQNVFFKSDKDFKKEKVIQKAFSLEDEINSRRVSGTSSEKIGLPVFKTRIRVAAHSADRLTRETISENISMAFTEIAENNELHSYRVRIGSRRYEIIEELNALRLSVRTRANGNVNLMSTDELSKIALQMPVQELQRRYDSELNVKRRIETDVPAELRDPKNLLIGWAEYKEYQQAVGLLAHMKDTFYCGYTFIGKQGSGKDTAIQNFVYEGCIKHGISFVIPDWICQEGHKGMADGIRDLLPPDMIIDLDFSDPEYSIPLDLTDIIKKIGRDGLSTFGDEMVDFMNMGELTKSKHILKVAAKASGGSLFNLKKLLTDVEYRVDVAEELQNRGEHRLAGELLEWVGGNDEVLEDLLGSKADPILDRLGDFFDNDRLYDIFSQQPKKEVDFERWMKEGKVIICRMPKRKLGRASATLAHWLTLKVLMTRMLMSDEDKERHGCFMVFNEPEQVESRGLAEFMSRIATEGRKERLGSVFAFHHWDKLPDSLQKNLQGGGVNQFLFASDYKKNFEAARERLEPTFTIEEAMQTPKHYAIAILNTKEALPAVMVHMLPPRPEEERYNNSFLTKRHARMFGRSWRELQSYGTEYVEEA